MGARKQIKIISDLGRKERIALAAVILLLAFSATVLFLFFPPIHQDPVYHRFAPTTVESSGIPNTFNVVTNLPFAVIGFIGIILCQRLNRLPTARSWTIFFGGIFLTSIGSAYYHLNPNDATLVWDRLPMTIAFSALFVALLSECLNPKLERFFLIPLVIAGICSVLYWKLTDDLRVYALVQFFPLIALPLVVVLVPSKLHSGRYLFVGLAGYILAKISEAYDYEIWRIIGLSGHALKHLFAGCSTLSLLIMLYRRRSDPDIL